MKKTIAGLMVACTLVFGHSLSVEKGIVKAHTEVFGDSTIDPETTAIVSHLTEENGITSLRGSIDVNVRKLYSDNSKRDEHMVGAIESDKYPVATYTFREVIPEGGHYTISGYLNFHGIKRPLKFDAEITQNAQKMHIKAKSHIKLSEYMVKPIKLLFLTVRDRVDLNVDVTLYEQ
jgi:polyisoprenoid-binding protein YceI